MSKKKNDPVNLKENAPLGSFEYIRELINDALQTIKLFPNTTAYMYLMYVYPEKIIVGMGNKYYEIGYQITIDEVVVFGKPVEVEQYYAVKEGDKRTPDRIETGNKKTVVDELKEAGIAITKPAKDMDFDLDFIRLVEDSYNPETGEVEVILIEAGTNPHKKRHYPDATIEEAAGLFSGLKMYINHPTAAQDRERPERDLRDWASTIVESYPAKNKQNGRAQARGKVAIHDGWLRERLKDPVAREHIGLSINTGGKVSYGKVNGEEMQIVEKIILSKQNGPASVDWVTEAGARGRVSPLLKESSAVSKEKKKMELKDASFADLQRENPTLVKELTESVAKTLKESNDQARKDQELKESKERVAQLEKENKLSKQKEIVSAALKEAKTLPDVAKTRIEKEFSSTVIENEKDLREAVGSRIKEELAYLSNFTQKGKIKAGSGGSENTDHSLVEANQATLEKRMGLDKPEEKETEK